MFVCKNLWCLWSLIIISCCWKISTVVENVVSQKALVGFVTVALFNIGIKRVGSSSNCELIRDYCLVLWPYSDGYTLQFFLSDLFPMSMSESNLCHIFANPVGAFHQHEDEKGQGEARPYAGSATLFSCQLWAERSECYAAWSFWWIRPGTLWTDAGEKDSESLCCVRMIQLLENHLFIISPKQPLNLVLCIFHSQILNLKFFFFFFTNVVLCKKSAQCLSTSESPILTLLNCISKHLTGSFIFLAFE